MVKARSGQGGRETGPVRRSPRWRRIAARTILVSGLLAVLIVAVVVLSPRSPAVRQAVLVYAGGVVERSAGLRATAGDFSVRLWRGEIEIRDLELSVAAAGVAAAGTRPFLTVPEVTVAVSWASFLGDRIVVRTLRIAEPRVDLGAPLPEASGEPAAGSTAPGVDFERFEIGDGEVVGGGKWSVQLDSLSAGGVNLEGSFIADRLQVEILSARLIAESELRPPIEASLSASLTGVPGGLMKVEALTLAGDGLRLEASGSGEAARRAATLSFELGARPSRLFPDLTSGGELDAAGDLELAGGRLAATAHIVARELPGELFEAVTATGFDPAGTVVDLDAEVETEADVSASGEIVPNRLIGHAAIDWRRGNQQLVRATVRSTEQTVEPDGATAPGVYLAFAADLLPAEPGRRQFEGSLRAPTWAKLDGGVLEATRIRLELPNLVEAAEQLGLKGDLGGFHPAGELMVQGTVSGPVRGPELRLAGAWSLDDWPIATVAARTLEGARLEAPLHLAFEAELMGGSEGHRRLAGELLAGDTRRLIAGQLESIELRDVEIELDSPDVAATADDLRRLWQRVFPGRDAPGLLVADTGTGGLLTGMLGGTVRASGSLLTPEVELDLAWRPSAGESVMITGHGELAPEPPWFEGQARLAVASLDLARFDGGETEDGLSGEIAARLDFDGTIGSHRAVLELEAADLSAGSGPVVSSLHLRAESDGTAVEIDALDGELATGQPFSGRGRLLLATGPGRGTSGESEQTPIRAGRFRFELARPIETLERAIASVTLEGGDLQAEIAVQERGEAPRPVALAKVPAGVLLGAGDRAIWLGLSGLEIGPFVGLLELDEDLPLPRATLDGSLSIELADLGASSGTIEISGLVLAGRRRVLEAVEPLRLELAGRRLELLPGSLLASGTGGGALEVAASLDLAPGWVLGDGLGALVSDFALELSGSFETSALEAILGGVRASGEATVELAVHGPASAPTVEGLIDGTRVTLSSAAPYATRIEAPVVVLSARPGGTTLESLRARLNGGMLSAQGSLDRESGLALRATFGSVRYRLDHGLSVFVGGDLELGRRESRYLLAGEVVVERGSLRRDLEIDREVLSLLLAPDLTSTDEASLLAGVDLDLSVTTAEGVRIKNNLADLKADWSLLRVRGTLQNPLLAGRLEVVPGGRITGYGQTVRIDEASLAFSGDPAVSPRLRLETTSSLEDPTLREDRRGLPGSSSGGTGPGAGGYWDRRRDEVSVSDELTTGLLTHYSDRVASSFAGGLESTELSLEPLPIFGEADTQARLTATRRLSANADLVYSVNPRDAEGQTYILDLHDFDVAPGIRAQLFTNDDNREGAALVQVLELGAGSRKEHGPRLRRLAIEAPDRSSRRGLEKAIGLRKGDPLPAGATFDVESDALEEMRRQGYPRARLSVAVEPTGRRRELRIAVEPGPRVDFEFAGELPTRWDRHAIARRYRVGDQDRALEELRRETVKALRGRGFPEPRVEVTVTQGEQDSAGGDGVSPGSSVVRVRADGGRRIDPGPPELTGLSADDSAAVAAQFTSLGSRVELAAATAGADRYLLQLLKALGYPQAEITGRRLDDDGRRLVVHVEPGVRRLITEIEITGLPADEAARLQASLPVAEGDPARSDLVTRSAHTIEDDLRARGHAEVQVRTKLEPAAGTPGGSELALRFAVEPGPVHHIGEVLFDGLARTRTSFAGRVAGLRTGGVFRQEDLGAARARLSRTGLFESIRTKADPSRTAPGAADGEPPGTLETPVLFEVTEGPRYLIAYGGRWESGEGLGLVADVVNRNFLGRGMTLGLRAVHSGSDERSLRLYHAAPRVLGTHASLEVFVEGKNEYVEGIATDSFEGWAQITSPLGPRTKNRIYLRYQDLLFKAPVSGSEADSEPGERLVIPSLGWQLSFDTRTAESEPWGLSFGLDLVGAHQDLGSDYSVLGIFSQLKLFRTLADLSAGRTSGPSPRKGANATSPRRGTWAQSLRVGLQEPFADTDIPLVNRLRAGGEYSVRGYRTDSLGPLDADGNALGGEVFFIVNEELRFPLWRETISGLLFVDAGNVWASRDAFDFELLTSVGLGLRAKTPVGPLRLDFAVPLDRRAESDDFKIYLGFGNVF